MPPESFDQHSRYGPRLDIFSFGHLALFTLTQVFPGTLLPPTYPDPDNLGRLLGRSEVERRTNYIQPLQEQLGEQHPLLQLICQCLHNIPAQRPSGEELLHQLEAVRSQIKGTHGRQQVKVEMARLQVAMMSVLEAEVGEKDGELGHLRRDLQQVQVDKERLQAVVEAKDTQLQQKDDQIQQKDDRIQQQGTELQERTLQLNRQQREVQSLREDRKTLQAEVEAKDAEIDRQQRELQTQRRLAQEKDAELHRQQKKLQALRAEMDARIAEIQQQLRERDAEINRLQRGLRVWATSREESVAAVQSPPQKPQVHLLSELIWKRLPDMPVAMVLPQSVAVDTAVYIADRWESHVIHKYDLQTKEWTKLPQYQWRYFTMTELAHQLVLVGGYDESTNKTSNAVAVYSTSQKSWKQPYPPMNTPRSWPAVCTYQQRLVVAGGCIARRTNLTTVEILDTSTLHKQWLSATPLPVRCHLMSAAIIHDTLYLLGGKLCKQVLSVSLSALTQTAKPPVQWRTLSDAPLEQSTAITVHESLLAVGGSHGGQRSSAIYLYDQEKNAWNKMGDLPIVRAYCACCLLPSGEILVAGGEDRNGKWTSRMDVAAVKD